MRCGAVIEWAKSAAAAWSTVSRPVSTAIDISDRVSDAINVYSENARLREENANLLQWQSFARKLEVENRSLRERMYRWVGLAVLAFAPNRAQGLPARGL